MFTYKNLKPGDVIMEYGDSHVLIYTGDRGGDKPLVHAASGDNVKVVLQQGIKYYTDDEKNPFKMGQH